MRAFVSIAAALIGLAVGAPAAAQQTTFTATDHENANTPSWAGNTIGDPTSDWGRCTGRDYSHPAPGIRSCGRIIGERVSRVHSAAAHLYRGQLYEAGGNAQRAQSDYAEAATLFEEISLSEPRDPVAFTNYASALARLERYDDAVAAYTHAFTLLGSTERSAAAAGTHVGTRAEETATEAAHVLAGYRYGRGSLYFQKGDYANAALDFDEAARLWPEAALYQGARCEARAAARSELEVAAVACDEAVRLADDDFSHALFARGYLHYMQGDFQAAWSDFSAAVEKGDDCEHALYGRGVAAQQLGRVDEGAADIAQARANDPFESAYYERAGLRR